MCAKCGCGCKPGKPAAGCKCKCSTCAGAKDKKQDAKVMKGMSPKQKGAFEKADKKMDSKKPLKEIGAPIPIPNVSVSFKI